MTLAEILAQADFTDDIEFEVKGNKFKVGDLRGFRTAADSEKAAAAEEKKRAEKVARDAKEMLTALDTAMKEIQAANTPPDKSPAKGDSWKKNPLYEEIVPVVEAMELQLKTTIEIANATKKSLDTAQAVYALERMRRQWAEAPSKPKDAKFEEVVANVIAAKELDQMGLPTLENWLHRTSEPDRIKSAVEEAIKKNNADWEQKARMGAGAKPGSSTRFSTKKAAEPPIKNLNDLTSELVAGDPDIAAAMNGETIQ